MTTQVIPTGDDPFSVQTTTLDGTAYVLSFSHNQREAAWSLTLATQDGDVLAAGVKLVCNWDLLIKCVDPARPPGKLFVISLTTDTSTPGLEDLVPGGRCLLIYIPLANIQAFEASTASSSS